MANLPAEKLLAVAEAPPTVDATLQAAYKSADIYLPFLFSHLIPLALT
jgi:hypothetical protein